MMKNNLTEAEHNSFNLGFFFNQVLQKLHIHFKTVYV